MAHKKFRAEKMFFAKREWVLIDLQDQSCVGGLDTLHPQEIYKLVTEVYGEDVDYELVGSYES